MQALLQDLRYAARGCTRRRGMTAIIGLTLAIGIGSNVAIFSVANAVLFRPLPYQDPERLVLIWNRQSASDRGRSLVSGPDFLDYRQQTTMFEDFAGAFAINGTLTGEGRAQQVMAGWTSDNFFKVLGVRPSLGRDFDPEDTVSINPADFMDPNADIPPGVAILSHSLWQQRYGGDPDVVGKSIELDGQRSRVVGVLSADFQIYLPADAGMRTDVDVWRALPIDLETNPREAPWLTVVARLKSGVTVAQAQAEMDSVAARLREQYRFHANAETLIEVNSMHQDVVSHIRPTLFALLGAGGFVLLIACANVANLLLAQAAARRREIALRASLGAGQWRIVQQMLVESGLLSLLGGLAGLGLAWAGIRVLISIRPDNLPRLEQVDLDTTVILFGIGVTALSALAFGLVPALRSASPDLAFDLKERGSDSGGIRGNKLRTGLVVIEVALSLVLLIGAGLLMRSFASLGSVEPGFRTDSVLTFSLPLPMFSYREPPRRTDFYNRFRNRVAALPGVEAVGSVTPLPLAGGDQYYVLSYGRLDATEKEWNQSKADYRWIVPGYFEAMGIRLVAGRLITEADNREGALPVLVVDAPLAARLWPDSDPIGQQLRVQRFNLENFDLERVSMTVAGVVEHIRSESLSAVGREAIYFPLHSFPYAPQTVVVRGATDPTALVGAIQRELDAMDPDVPMAEIRLIEEYISDATAQTRFTLTLIAVFSLLALVLAAVGLYGVISFSVHQRTQEIGVRMAFGAQAGDVLRLIVGQGLVIALVGVIVGVVTAASLTRLAASLLYNVSATDPFTFSGISLLLIAVAAVASYIPARRAMRVDPLEALRGATASASSSTS